MLERGIKVLLLDKCIWENESLADIKLIIDVDNQDQMTCMADHELHMLNRIRTVTAEQSQVVNPTTLFERVFEQLESSAGPLNKKDVHFFYTIVR